MFTSSRLAAPNPLEALYIGGYHDRCALFKRVQLAGRHSENICTDDLGRSSFQTSLLIRRHLALGNRVLDRVGQLAFVGERPSSTEIDIVDPIAAALADKFHRIGPVGVGLAVAFIGEIDLAGGRHFAGFYAFTYRKGRRALEQRGEKIAFD